MITSSDVYGNNLSVDELLAAEVEEVLRKRSVFTPTVRMRQARIGVKSYDYVLGDDISVVSVAEDGSEPESTGLLPTTVNIAIDKHKAATKFLTYRALLQSDVDLRDEFMRNAPAKLAEQMEADNIAAAKAGIIGGNELDFLNNTGAGTGSLTLDDIIEADKVMNEAKLPKMGRYFMLSPKQYAEALKIEAIQDASKRGNSEAIENGFVARTLGFTFLMSNDLLADECLFYHESCFAMIMQQGAQVEFEDQKSKSREYHAVKALYGQGLIHDSRIWRIDQPA